ncbi:flagellar basal-body rod protein FlgF [Polynucleobacter sp. AP-Feld-500C-C5]|uniref:flagellar basal-body rod protein FlgF n=1 Tax=Polynucleobacter sp. AP-Feld-500C-C5 TaxID=2576924 RepID=UPI001C0D53CA|nr:flagellar basal-body rod protein FlgF [Polynucleobacter sp. AP-Feld-500C-C5]MBU3633127.1 flagellar basal-body rod protein FlgF [Polynucleobacter sp. AP-Feld-500C-C5]
MDRVIYTAMTGAKHILDQQSTNSNNLANVSTTGFKAQIDSFLSVPVLGGEIDTRAFVINASNGTDFTPGTIQQTGRTLDVAIEGKGWFSVQRPDGSEGLTRNGSFKVSENGILQTAGGRNVLGGGGPITIPPNVNISIGADGTISSIDPAISGGPSTPIDVLKLSNPDEKKLVRGSDGLFNNQDLSPIAADPTVRVVNGALESSNVNVVQGMVNMISLARQFDIQMQLMKNAEDSDQKAAQLFSLN